MRETLINDIKSPSFKCCNTRSNNLPAADILEPGDSCFSFELCPNRNLDTDLLATLKPNSCSVTWLVHDPTTLKNVDDIPAVQLAQQLCYQGYSVILHLTGKYLTEDDAIRILDRVKSIGVKSVLALQGDALPGWEKRANKCHFKYAADFVKFIKNKYGKHFRIGVAGYPEKHPLSPTKIDDINYLKNKVLSGADFIITQATYYYEHLENFAKTCRANQISVPIIPGILAISSYKMMMAMSNFCSISIPEEILAIVNKNKENDATIRKFGIFISVELIKKVLSRNGDLFHGFHVFTLNDIKLTEEVLIRLKLWKMWIHRPLPQYEQFEILNPYAKQYI